MVKSIVARCVMGIRVLVVDDSGFMRKRIVEELKAQGHSVVGEAKGGNEAVELYRTLRPDLVTMDITMRDKDGITAQEILSEDPTPISCFSPFLTMK
jgi:two-component system chemotaxis response regulator CheY